jgi:hypothetical protein
LKHLIAAAAAAVLVVTGVGTALASAGSAAAPATVHGGYGHIGLNITPTRCLVSEHPRERRSLVRIGRCSGTAAEWAPYSDQTVRLPTGRCLVLRLVAGRVALEDGPCTTGEIHWLPDGNRHLVSLDASRSPQAQVCAGRPIGSVVPAAPCNKGLVLDFPDTLVRVTQLTDRPDSGGTGNWALDNMARNASVTYLGALNGVRQWEGSIDDQGSFVTFPGAFTPNQGLDAGKTIGDALTGTVSGHWEYLFTSSAPLSKLPPPAQVAGYGTLSTPDWYQRYFVPSATFTGGGVQSGPGDWSWSYSSVRDNCGHIERWTDAGNDNSGQNATGPSATDITAPTVAACG